jgi:hypothetical protein
MFERYTKKPCGRGRPSVSRVVLRRSGCFSFSTECDRIYGLSRYSHIVFHYDEEGGRIGFRFHNDADEAGSYKLQRRRGEVSTLVVCGRAFCAYFGIDYKIARTFIPAWDEGLLVIETKTKGIEL